VIAVKIDYGMMAPFQVGLPIWSVDLEAIKPRTYHWNTAARSPSDSSVVSARGDFPLYLEFD